MFSQILTRLVLFNDLVVVATDIFSIFGTYYTPKEKMGRTVLNCFTRTLLPAHFSSSADWLSQGSTGRHQCCRNNLCGDGCCTNWPFCLPKGKGRVFIFFGVIKIITTQ